MLGIRLSGRTLIIEERNGKETHVHFDSRGNAVAVQLVMAQQPGLAAQRTLSWKAEGKRSPFTDSKPLGRADFWSQLRSALRVAVGS